MNTRKLIAAILGIVNFIIIFFVCLSYYLWDGGASMNVWGPELFAFYTNDSNILASVSTLILSFFLFFGKEEPKWLQVIRLMGTTSICLTFTVVLFYLAPFASSFSFLYDKIGIFTHCLCPLMTIAIFLLIGNEEKHKWTYSLLGIIPTILYGIVYLTEVVIIGEENGGWNDFYSFTVGGVWPLVIVIIMVSVFVFSNLLLLGQRKMAGFISRKEASYGKSIH